MGLGLIWNLKVNLSFGLEEMIRNWTWNFKFMNRDGNGLWV